MNLKRSILLGVSLVFATTVFAQVLTQTVRGVVIDKNSQATLPGATLVLVNSNPLVGVNTDADGKFQFNQVPVGKQMIKVTFLGYKEVTLQNLSVNSGKEVVLTIQMEEDIQAINEVVVSSKVEKNKPLNEMSTVSTRTFSVEETQKFAAAANDPLRMAIAFAGVVSGGDFNNVVSIRGNAPNGLLWYMEGIEIPNPNHFANSGTSGGGISILSSQLLSNSDFSTGAFAAEYGNALSGVFDLKLRKGNNRKREYTFQLGVLGADASTEGPFKKGYDGSYLANYRYSTLSILSKMGVPIGDATTNFQDLSLNVSLPTKKLGTFSVFGFGGLSSQTAFAEKDSMKWKEDEYKAHDQRFYSNTGAIGVTNTKLFSNQSYLRTVISLSGTQNGFTDKKLLYDYKTVDELYQQQYAQTKLTFSTAYTQKINAKSNIRAGIIVNQLGYNFLQKEDTDSLNMVEKINVKGTTQTAQVFFQWNYKLSPKLTSNIGMHYLRFFLNNSNSIEPRASLKYELTKRNYLTAGYGLHSQLQPLGVYFAKQQNADNTFTVPNRNLGLSKAHHLVLGYDFIINEYSHVKTETYYQHLFNIPVTVDQIKTFSMLNNTDGYVTDPLVNNGIGRNMGVELTYERFMYRNLYYLLSVSLYDSKYKAANGKWYDTRFNTNYAVAFTAGKEWTLSERRKNRIIGLNIKSIYVGGFRYTPIDLPASIAAGETKEDESKTFENKNPDYWRLDVGVSAKRNFKKLTSTLSLDIQNVTNRKNVGGQYFDVNTGAIKYWYQTPLLPILSYRLEF